MPPRNSSITISTPSIAEVVKLLLSKQRVVIDLGHFIKRARLHSSMRSKLTSSRSTETRWSKVQRICHSGSSSILTYHIVRRFRTATSVGKETSYKGWSGQVRHSSAPLRL